MIKKKILQTVETMFLRYGVKSITMDDIARELGMSKKTLYQYVDNKSDLVQQIMDNHIEVEKYEVCAIHDNAKNAIDEMLKIAKYVIQQLREMSPTIVYDLKKYYQESWKSMDDFHREHVYKCISDNIVWGIEEGLYRTDLNIDVIAKLYVGKSMLVVEDDLFPLKTYDRETLFNEFINYHIHGIASSKGLKVLKKYTNKK